MSASDTWSRTGFLQSFPRFVAKATYDTVSDMISIRYTLTMRRTDRQLPDNAAMKVLQKGSHGVLAMTSEEYGVYAIPMNYAVTGMTVYFHGAREGTKTELLKQRPRATLVCVTEDTVLAEKFTTQYESAIARGRVRIVEDEKERMEGLKAFIHRYSPDYIEKGERYIENMKGSTLLFALDIESLEGKKRQ